VLFLKDKFKLKLIEPNQLMIFKGYICVMLAEPMKFYYWKIRRRT